MKRPKQSDIEQGVADLYAYINNLEILAGMLQATIRENHEWHERYDDHDGYPGSGLAEANTKALEHDLPIPEVPWPVGCLVKNLREHGVNNMAKFTVAVPPGSTWEVTRAEGNNRVIRCRNPNTTVSTDTVELDEHFVIHQLPV